MRFLQRNKLALCMAIGMYMFGVCIGLLAPSVFPISEEVVTPSTTSQEYIENNLSVALFMMIGFATLGIYTGITLAFNGLILGLVLTSAMPIHSWIIVAAGLVPHGIFEVPGTLLAGMVGLKSAEWCILSIKGQAPPKMFQDCIVGIVTSVLLIIIAAPTEAIITPWVMEQVSS